MDVEDRERFESKVGERGDGCWEWTAGLRKGYGSFRVSGRKRKMEYAHRVAWELTNGPIPDGFCVCHHCDNRKCVRPDHLFLGSPLDNARDRDAKGRSARGERVNTAKLTEAQVREIHLRLGREPQRKIGEAFGVHHTTIGYIARKKAWTHVGSIS